MFVGHFELKLKYLQITRSNTTYEKPIRDVEGCGDFSNNAFLIRYSFR